MYMGIILGCMNPAFFMHPPHFLNFKILHTTVSQVSSRSRWMFRITTRFRDSS